MLVGLVFFGAVFHSVFSAIYYVWNGILSELLKGCLNVLKQVCCCLFCCRRLNRANLVARKFNVPPVLANALLEEIGAPKLHDHEIDSHTKEVLSRRRSESGSKGIALQPTKPWKSVEQDLKESLLSAQDVSSDAAV